ncbi:O-antigen ligase family protein [Micrococcus terreus]|uniref:O-antigen ligase family protein n=1 Tax=Micrococcus terreus TaxID=574650 RepID=UPI003D73178D
MKKHEIAADPDRKFRSSRAWEVAIIVLVISRPEWVGTDISIIAMAAYVVVVSVIRRTPWTARISPAMVLFILLATLSIGWTPSISSTLIYTGASICTIACALFTASVPSREEALVGLMRGFKIAAFASLGVGLALPEIGIMGGIHTNGALIGIYPHRNVLAGVIAFGLALAFAYPRLLGRWALTKVAWLGLFAVVLFMAGSSTAILAVLLAISTAVVVLALRNIGFRSASLPFVMGGITIALGVALAVSQLPRITELLGRTSTLSGRTTIWTGVLEAARDHPWLGAGWGAAWQEDVSVSAAVRAYTSYSVTDAHNGYLDVLVQLGFLGFACFLIFFVVTIVRALSYGLRGTTFGSLWPITTLTLLAIVNFSESRAHEFLGWFLIILLYSVTTESGNWAEPDNNQTGQSTSRGTTLTTHMARRA